MVIWAWMRSVIWVSEIVSLGYWRNQVSWYGAAGFGYRGGQGGAGGKVPGKSNGVEGDPAVAVGGNGGIYKFDRAERRKVDVGYVNKLFLEVGAI